MLLPLSENKKHTRKYKFIKKSHNNEGLNKDKHFIGFVGITAVLG
jgi:hypothetical protein